MGRVLTIYLNDARLKLLGGDESGVSLQKRIYALIDGLAKVGVSDSCEPVTFGPPCDAVGPHHGDPCKHGRVQCPNAQFTEDCRKCGGTGIKSVFPLPGDGGRSQ